MESFGQVLIRVRLEKGYKTSKSFFNHLKSRGLECNYQYFVKIEKNISFPSALIVNQIAKALPAQSGQEVVLAFCSNQFHSFDYLFKNGANSQTQISEKKEIPSLKIQGQKELSIKQVNTLYKRKENYFLFLLLTLSRAPIELSEVKKFKGLGRSIKDLVESEMALVEEDKITSTSTEFRFPKDSDRELSSIYNAFDDWDVEFSYQFNFDKMMNKMMIRRISPRYMSVIEKQIEALTDLVRLSDESDQKYNNDVLHLQIRMSKGEIPG